MCCENQRNKTHIFRHLIPRATFECFSCSFLFFEAYHPLSFWYGIICWLEKIPNRIENKNEEIILSRNHPQTSRLLGRARMLDHPAVLHPGGRGHDEPCHLFARAWPRAVECGICRTLRATR